MSALALEVQLRQHVSVLPQLVMRSELLGLTSDELETRVSDELESNPALELDERALRRRVKLLGDYSRLQDVRVAGAVDVPSIDERLGWSVAESVTQERSLRDDLLWQLSLQPERRRHSICAYLIHSIAPNGYLTTTVEDVADELEVPLQDVERALEILQGLSPTGVGARDLRECLLLQLSAADPKTVPPGTEEFLRDHLQAALQGRDKTAKRLCLSIEQVDAILEFVRRRLCPYPGLAFRVNDPRAGSAPARPDVILRREVIDAAGNTRLVIEVPESLSHGLRINAAYSELEARMRRGVSRLDPTSTAPHPPAPSLRGGEGERETASYPPAPLPRREGGERRTTTANGERREIAEQVRDARRFIDNLQRRYDVLRIVTEAIVAAQMEFIERGPEYLTPLDKKAIAAQTGLHESTVCRATRGKLVQMPDGIVVPFAIFFDDALPIRCLVRYIIEREDPQRPLSDDEIAARLCEGGHSIARRTVAKYRAELGIETAGQRKRTTPAPQPDCR
jgi:RNA polymerase sigma-54 factor